MGYYTNYQLSVMHEERLVEDDELEPIMKTLEEISHYNFDEVDRNRLILWEAKWYDSRDDVAILSIVYPTYRFDLTGDGEDEGDVWESTFIGGYAHERDCDGDEFNSIPEFDPQQLIPYYLKPRKLADLASILPQPPDDEDCGGIADII